MCFLISGIFSFWLAYKANMKFSQGIGITAFSCIGSIISILILKKVIISSSMIFYFIFITSCVLLFTLLFLIYRFYRDPSRNIPNDENIIVSPADGRIIYIRKINSGQIPSSIKGRSNMLLSELTKTDILDGETYLIGIMMTIIDVHVNRAPIAGKVILNKHFPGKFLSLKDKTSITENERNTIVFKADSLIVGIIQIASKQVRRIVSYIDENDQVRIGQRVGAILFGSQVDVVLPSKSTSILVKEGEQVYAGETILAKF